MAQRPTHRLNLYLVPADPERELDADAVERGLGALRRAGVLSGWRPGPAAEHLVAGGFALLRLDHPPLPTIYGNRQGGYFVRCPSCGTDMVPAALRALSVWRSGGGRAARCPSCGASRELEDLETAPPARPARFALELRDVGGPELLGAHRPALERVLGGDFFVVASRG